MPQSSRSTPKLLLSRIVLAGVALLAMAWAGLDSELFSGLASSDLHSSSSTEPATVSNGMQVDESQNFATSDLENRSRSNSTSQSLNPVDQIESPLPETSSTGYVEVRGAANPVMLSDGSSLEDQLQAQRSAELRELYPVESSPSGTLSTPLAPPRAASPHQ